jgi:hypothetical protein
LREELFLTGGRAYTQQADILFRGVGERVRGIRWEAHGLTGSHRHFFAPERGFNFALEQRERFLEVMAVRRRTTSGRDVHIEQAVAAIGVLAGKNDRVGVSDKSDVRQALVRFRFREFERPLEIVVGDRGGGLGSDGVFVHGVTFLFRVGFWKMLPGKSDLRQRKQGRDEMIDFRSQSRRMQNQNGPWQPTAAVIAHDRDEHDVPERLYPTFGGLKNNDYFHSWISDLFQTKRSMVISTGGRRGTATDCLRLNSLY